MLKIVTVKIHLDNGSTGIETLIKKACLLLSETDKFDNFRKFIPEKVSIHEKVSTNKVFADYGQFI